MRLRDRLALGVLGTAWMWFGLLLAVLAMLGDLVCVHRWSLESVMGERLYGAFLRVVGLFLIVLAWGILVAGVFWLLWGLPL